MSSSFGDNSFLPVCPVFIDDKIHGNGNQQIDARGQCTAKKPHIKVTVAQAEEPGFQGFHPQIAPPMAEYGQNRRRVSRYAEVSG